MATGAAIAAETKARTRTTENRILFDRRREDGSSKEYNNRVGSPVVFGVNELRIKKMDLVGPFYTHFAGVEGEIKIAAP